MTQVIKLLGNTVNTAATNSNFSSCKFLRLVNTSTAASTITLSDAVANTLIGTITMAPNEVITLIKKKTDVVSSSNTLILATPVASTF